jgi:hypothetical protein
MTQPGASSRTADSSGDTLRRVLRISLQLAGFAICVGLLWWVVRGVLAPGNRTQLERLADAPAWKVAVLLLLAVGTIVINGGIFQVALSPVRRLKTVDIQSVNAIAALLALLPFKLSMVFRVVVHNRRDRLPLLTIAAWFVAIAATMAIAVLPALAASLWRGTVDALWWAAALGGIALLTAAVIFGAKLFGDGPGWAFLERFLRALPLPLAVIGTSDGARLGILPRIHEGLRMLAHPGAVFASVGLRMADATVYALRFLVAASILGVALPPDKAVIAGTAFFLIGAAAPTGQLGAREAGTAGVLATLMHGVDLDQFKLVVLLVSATEATTLLFLAMAGAAWLRPWRILGEPARRASPATLQQS